MRSWVCDDIVRVVPVMTTLSGITLYPYPPWIVPQVTTPVSSGSYNLTWIYDTTTIWQRDEVRIRWLNIIVMTNENCNTPLARLPLIIDEVSSLRGTGPCTIRKFWKEWFPEFPFASICQLSDNVKKSSRIFRSSWISNFFWVITSRISNATYIRMQYTTYVSRW